MRFPGFNAEAALPGAVGHYRISGASYGAVPGRPDWIRAAVERTQEGETIQIHGRDEQRYWENLPPERPDSTTPTSPGGGGNRQPPLPPLVTTVQRMCGDCSIENGYTEDECLEMMFPNGPGSYGWQAVFCAGGSLGRYCWTRTCTKSGNEPWHCSDGPHTREECVAADNPIYPRIPEPVNFPFGPQRQSQRPL